VAIDLIDDFDGSEAEQTVEFGIDGAGYAIDLSNRNANDLRDIFRRYVEMAHGEAQTL
jgi:hypothetical protein